MKIDQVSDSVYVVAGTNVNWALVSDGSGVTLVDAGYPADADHLLNSVRQIGHKLTDIAAVLLTHAHLDHIGAIPTLVQQIGMPVYTGTEEVRHAKREYLQQITPAQMIKLLITHRGRRWVAQTMSAVRGHIDTKIPAATAGDNAAVASLPGGFVAIPTPGHTSGHTAYLMPSEAVLFSGDAIVTGHPLLPHSGPQLLPKVFNHDETLIRDSAHKLATQPARTLVPGHGAPLHHDPTALTRTFQQP